MRYIVERLDIDRSIAPYAARPERGLRDIWYVPREAIRPGEGTRFYTVVRGNRVDVPLHQYSCADDELTLIGYSMQLIAEAILSLPSGVVADGVYLGLGYPAELADNSAGVANLRFWIGIGLITKKTA